MPNHPKPSYECRHQLVEWVRLHCPCATEHPEFVRGLLAIVERELRATARSERQPERDGGPA